jgi:hypothetical protein
VDMHATDLVGINGITPVLSVYTCQQGVYPRGHVLPLRLPRVLLESLFCLTKLLNIAMVGNCEVMLGQTLNHSV